MRLASSLPLLGFILLSACQQQSPQYAVGQPQAILTGFNVPECVAVDPASGIAYVSNIETHTEGYTENDARAFISTIKPDLTLDRLRWRDTMPRAPIHAPKGMCILNGILYVADNTRVLRFPLNGDPALEPINLLEARVLNDMATDGAAAYVSDTETGRIYRLDGTSIRSIKGPASVNGITFHAGRMFAVSWDLHEVYEMDATGQRDPQPFGLASHFKNLDGIEVLADGTFLVSDYTDNKVCTISPDRRKVHTLVETSNPADIGLDRKRSLLYIPQFTQNQVIVYRLQAPRP